MLEVKDAKKDSENKSLLGAVAWVLFVCCADAVERKPEMERRTVALRRRSEAKGRAGAR